MQSLFCVLINLFYRVFSSLFSIQLKQIIQHFLVIKLLRNSHPFLTDTSFCPFF